MIFQNSKAMDGTEDAASLSQHEKWLCVEGRKESADEGQVLVRMEVTRSARAASLAKLSVLDAVKKYPYLMTSEGVSVFLTWNIFRIVPQV